MLLCEANRGKEVRGDVVTAELQRVRSGWWHALRSHIRAQADINVTMCLPAGICCQLVALSQWWNIGSTELNCNTAFLIRVPVHVRVSRHQNDNHGAKSHYAQSSITCADLIIAVSTRGLWAVISPPQIHTRSHVCTSWSQPSIMKQQSSECNEHHGTLFKTKHGLFSVDDSVCHWSELFDFWWQWSCSKSFDLWQWLGPNVTLLLLKLSKVSWKLLVSPTEGGFLLLLQSVQPFVTGGQVWSVTKRLCMSYYHRPNTLLLIYLHPPPLCPRSSGGFE